MSTGIVTKIILLILGALVLVQLLFYNAVQVGNNDRLKNESELLKQEVANLSITKSELQDYIDQLQREYDDIAASVPTNILEGYEDPEVLLASFLDYLKAAEFEGVDSKVVLQGGRKFINKPVPIFEHALTVTFSFFDLSDAGNILSYILDQDYYPLAVRNFELRKIGEQRITGTMQLSLLIPVRQQKASPGMTGEGR